MLHRYPLETYSKTHSKIKMGSKIFNPQSLQTFGIMLN